MRFCSEEMRKGGGAEAGFCEKCAKRADVLGVRMLVARSRLTRTEPPVGGIAQEFGFYDQSHFTGAF